MPAFASRLLHRLVLALLLGAALLAADSASRVAAQGTAVSGGWFANSYLVDGRRAWATQPIAFDRRGGRPITLEDAEKADNARVTGYGLPDFPRPGQPPMPLWHIAVDGAPPTVLCHPERTGVDDRDESPASDRIHSEVTEELGPWLQVGAKVGTWYQGTSMPFTGGIHNTTDNGPPAHPYSFTDTWPRVHPQNVLIDVPGRYGCASLAAAELLRQVTFFGALQAVCDYVLSPIVLRYVSELRCEPDLFDSRTTREGWYEDFALGETNGGSTVSVDGVDYTDTHQFISGVHTFASGSRGRIMCRTRLGCRKSSTPHQHPRDYEGPTPWARRLEAALIHMSDINNVDAADYPVVERVVRVDPVLSNPATPYSEPFPVDPPIGSGGESGYSARAYPPPFYGVPPADRVSPSADPGRGGYYPYAYRYGHLLAPDQAPANLIEHPRAGFNRMIRTAKGPDCLRFLDPLNPVDPCAGGVLNRDSTGLMPATVSRSPNSASTVRAIDAGGTSAAGGGSTLVTARELTGAGLPFPADPEWSWVVANEATGACVYFHAVFEDLVDQALRLAAEARAGWESLERRIPLDQAEPDHEAAVDAMLESYYLQKDELAWRHIAELRRPLQELLLGALAAAGYSDYSRIASFTGGNGLVSRLIGPRGGLPYALPIATFPPSVFKASLSVGPTGSSTPGHNRCYSDFPGYLPPQPGRLAARPSRNRLQAVRIRPAESRTGSSLGGADVPLYDDAPLNAGLDAAASSIGVPAFTRSQPVVRSDRSRAYAVGAIADVGRTDPPVSAAAYDRFAADRRVELIDPLVAPGPPDSIGLHPGPSGLTTLSCPTFEVGVFDPGARFGATSRSPASPFSGELAGPDMRQADALRIYEDHSQVIGTVNQWCPPGSGTISGCDSSANPEYSVNRITTEVAYTVSQPIVDLFGLRYSVFGGIEFSRGCARDVWAGRARRYRSWNTCPRVDQLADWLVTAELYSGDAPLRTAPAGRGIGPQTAAEWRQVDQQDCAAAGLGNDCAWVVRSGYVQWWGDVYNGRDSGLEFGFTGGCFLSPPGATRVPTIGEDIRAPSVLQPDSSLLCYIKEPVGDDIVLGCDTPDDAVRRRP